MPTFKFAALLIWEVKMRHWYRNAILWVAAIALVFGFSQRVYADFDYYKYTGWAIDEAVADIKSEGYHIGSFQTDESYDPSEWNTVDFWRLDEETGRVELYVHAEPGPLGWEFLAPTGTRLAVGESFSIRFSRPISYFGDGYGGFYIPTQEMSIMLYELGWWWSYTSVEYAVDVTNDAHMFTFRVDEHMNNKVNIVRIRPTNQGSGPRWYFFAGSTVPTVSKLSGYVELPRGMRHYTIDRANSVVFLRNKDDIKSELLDDGTPIWDLWKNYFPSYGIGMSLLGEPSYSAHPYSIEPTAPAHFYVGVSVRVWHETVNFGKYLFATTPSLASPQTIDLTGGPQNHSFGPAKSSIGLDQGDAYLEIGGEDSFSFATGCAPSEGQEPDIKVVYDPDTWWYVISNPREGVKYARIGPVDEVREHVDFQSPYPGTPEIPSLDDESAWFNSMQEAADAAGYWATIERSVFAVYLPDDTYALVEFTDPNGYDEEAIDFNWNYYFRWAWQPDGSTNFGPSPASEIEMPDVVGMPFEDAIAAVKAIAPLQSLEIQHVLSYNESEWGTVTSHNPPPGYVMLEDQVFLELYVAGPPATTVNIVDISPANGEVGVGQSMGGGQVSTTVAITLDQPIRFMAENDRDSPLYGEAVPSVEIHIAGGGRSFGSLFPDQLRWDSDHKTIYAEFRLDENRAYDYVIQGRNHGNVGYQLSPNTHITGTFATGNTFVGATISGTVEAPVGAPSQLPIEGVFLTKNTPFSLSIDGFDALDMARLVTTDDRSFEIRGVEPGTYWLVGVALDMLSFETPYPQAYMGVYDPDLDGFPNAIVVENGTSFSGLRIVLDEMEWVEDELFVTSVSPLPKATNVETNTDIVIAFDQPLKMDDNGHPRIDVLITPMGGAVETPISRENATLIDGNTVSWTPGLASNQAFQLAILDAVGQRGQNEKRLPAPLVLPFTTGDALPTGSLTVNVGILSGVEPELAEVAVALLSDVPETMNTDTWEHQWLGFGDTHSVSLTNVPDGEYYVGVVPFDDMLLPALYTVDGEPATVTISGDHAEIGVGLEDRVFRIESTYPAPNAVNVPTDTTFTITYTEPVPTSENGKPNIEVTLLPVPLGYGTETLVDDYTVQVSVTLAENTTYQVGISTEGIEQPYIFIFGTGSKLDNGVIAGRLSLAFEIPEDDHIPRKPSQSELYEIPFMVALLDEIPAAYTIDAMISKAVRIALTTDLTFVLENVPAGEYYLFAVSMFDGPGMPQLVGFLDANDVALPDVITVGPSQQITGVNLGVNQVYGWPRLLDADPPMFGTGVAANDTVTITLRFSSDFYPQYYSGGLGEVQTFPVPLSGYLSGDDFELTRREDGNWNASAEVVLAPNTTYSLWIFDAHSMYGGMIHPIRHVFSTADEIPSGTIKGVVSAPPLTTHYYEQAGFVAVSSMPGVPDITGDIEEATRNIVGISFIEPTSHTTGKFTANYLPYGEVFPTAFLVRDDDENELPTIIDYGQPAGDGAVIITPQKPKVTGVNIKITDRQGRLRLVESTPAANAASVPTETTLTYRFTEPVYDDGSWKYDEIQIFPQPLSMEEQYTGDDHVLAIDVVLAENTTYQTHVSLGEISFEQVFTTSASIGTGTIAGSIGKSSQLSNPTWAGVMLLDEMPTSLGFESMSIIRTNTTISGDYSFENIEPGSYYVVAAAYFRDLGQTVFTPLPTQSIELGSGQYIGGVNAAFGMESIPLPPVVESFDAAVVFVSQDVPMMGPITLTVPIYSARVSDPNGVDTIVRGEFSGPGFVSDNELPVSPGVFEGIGTPISEFWGGTFSFRAEDADGNWSSQNIDYVGSKTLSKPVISNPISGATDVSFTPRLSWSKVPNAQGYIIHVSTANPINIMSPIQGIEDFFAPENTVINFRSQVVSTNEFVVPTGVLDENQEYWWAIGAIDNLDNVGQIVLSNVSSFKTRSGDVVADTTPPVLVANPEVIGLTESTITLAWETDEASDSRVFIGTAAGALTDSVVSTRLVTEHVVRLTDLTPNTQYFLAISSADAAGNRMSYTLPRSVQTKAAYDTQPPIFVAEPRIEGIGQEQVTVLWETNKATTGFIVVYNNDIEKEIYDYLLARSHRVVVTDLEPATRYEFVVIATDENGNESEWFTGRPFTTRQTEDITPPLFLERPTVNAREVDAIVRWLADEPHTAVMTVRNAANGTIVSETHHSKLAAEQTTIVTSLTPGTEYEITIIMRDAFGNETTEARPVAFRTRAIADVTPPVLLSRPNVVYRSDRRIVLVWETDEPSDSFVRIYKDDVVVDEFSDGAFVRRHRMVITGLQAGQNYDFQIASRDPAGNELVYPEVMEKPALGRIAKAAARGGTAFTTSPTPDTQNPVITSSPTVTSVTASTMTINWETDETANSVVYYEDMNSGKVTRAAAVNPANSLVRPDYVTRHSMTLTGLNAGAPYRWRVASTDPSGNGETLSSEIVTSTLASEDITPPVFITPPTVIGKTDNRLTVRWTTDEPANSVVRFRRAGTSDGFDEVVDETLVLEHVVTLTNLHASTNYDISAMSMDLVGNGPTTAATTGTTDAAPDITPPTLTEVNVRPDANQVRITWTTDEPADSWIDFGTTLAYGTVVSKDAFTTTHEIILTNLENATEYFYQLASADASGNIGSVTNLTFTTLEEVDTTPPQKIRDVMAMKGAYAVRITWPANDDSLSVAGYIVERSAGGGTFQLVAGPVTARRFTDQTVVTDTEYAYRVVAKSVSALGTLSDPSDAITVTPTFGDAPNAPTPVAFDTTGRVDPTLTVQNATANNRPVGSYTFIVARDAALTQIVSTGTGILPMNNTTQWNVPVRLEHLSTYFWAARAADTEGFVGPQSAVASFLVDTTAKPVSVALATLAATSEGRSVAITWELGMGTALGFNVLRSNGISDTPVTINGTLLTGGPSFEWIDANIIPGQEYAYQIEALLPSGGTQVFGPVFAMGATPREVALRQNLPNPFNPATVIRYEMPENAHVQLVVYNALGQPIRTLVDASRAAGWHAVTWDGLDNTGRLAASGVYIARLVVTDNVDAGHREIRVMRMLMLR